MDNDQNDDRKADLQPEQGIDFFKSPGATDKSTTLFPDVAHAASDSQHDNHGQEDTPHGAEVEEAGIVDQQAGYALTPHR